uniref:Uncharacterized protein n=1 Tax=Rhizophora mucronata TaxID=61149 RepID=A0A2P2P3S4_RHIMU
MPLVSFYFPLSFFSLSMILFLPRWNKLLFPQHIQKYQLKKSIYGMKATLSYIISVFADMFLLNISSNLIYIFYVVF